ncbi:MAG: hypothetical protein IT436_12210 [Phycisphaerales bacterium]|nr:hypothetical protein [Phycisphaerales bacterium]
MSLWSPFRAYRTAHPDNYHMWLCFLGWLLLFAVGVSAPSEPFRTILVSIITQTKTAAGFDVKPIATPAPAGPANPTTPGTPANPARDAQAIAGPVPASPDTAALTRTAAFTLASGSPILEPLKSPRPPDAENSAGESAEPKAAPTQPAAGASPTPGWSWPVRIAAVAPLVLAVFVTFTPTNLLLLCCFSAALGSYAVRLIPQAFDAAAAPATGSSKSRPAEPPPEPPGVPAVIAMLHGLIVFAAAVAGLIVVQGEFQWDQTRGDLYLRLAATVTIVSIAAGTNRHFVRDLAQAFMPFRAGQNLSGPRGAGPGPGPGGGGVGGGGGGGAAAIAGAGGPD